MFIHNVLVFILYVLVQSYVSVVVFVWPGISFSRCLVVMRPWCVANDERGGFPVCHVICRISLAICRVSLASRVVLEIVCDCCV